MSNVKNLMSTTLLLEFPHFVCHFVLRGVCRFIFADATLHPRELYWGSSTSVENASSSEALVI